MAKGLTKKLSAAIESVAACPFAPGVELGDERDPERVAAVISAMERAHGVDYFHNEDANVVVPVSWGRP